MTQSRRKFSITFKTQVVLESLSERLTMSELAIKHNIHPQQVALWKKEFVENAEKAFSDGNSQVVNEKDKEIDELNNKIGRLNMENEWLKKRVL